MKLVTLNLWGGRQVKEIEEFLVKYNKEVDIFCFQEVFLGEKFVENDEMNKLENIERELYENLVKHLLHHQGLFCPVWKDYYGLAFFTHQDIKVIDSGEEIIYTVDEKEEDHTRKLQWVLLEKEGKEFMVVNLHGHWTSGNKMDTPARVEQSKIIKKFLAGKSYPIILCGDFNARPDTEAMRMFEPDLLNLVTKYGVTSTRTSLYTKEEKFADYILTSPQVEVKDFKVLPEEPSDHSPLYLEFSVN